GATAQIPRDGVGRRRSDSLEVDALVFEEVLVLGCQDGLDDRFGYVGVADGLGIASVVELGQELTACGVDTRDPGQVGEAQLHRLGVGDPFLLKVLEGAEGSVGPHETEQPHPGGGEDCDGEECGQGAEPTAAPLAGFHLMYEGFPAHREFPTSGTWVGFQDGASGIANTMTPNVARIP